VPGLLLNQDIAIEPVGILVQLQRLWEHEGDLSAAHIVEFACSSSSTITIN